MTLRLGGTLPSFALADREKPFRQAIRLYLVPNRTASQVRRRLDPRVYLVGAGVPDRNFRGR